MVFKYLSYNKIRIALQNKLFYDLTQPHLKLNKRLIYLSTRLLINSTDNLLGLKKVNIKVRNTKFV